MDTDKIRVKVNGGYIVAGRNADPNYDGIYIIFQTDDGYIIDLVVTECPTQDDKKKINVYSSENIYDEGFTRKQTFDIAEMTKALNSEN